MQDLLVSVVVPIYNVEKYINQCIDSILSQDYVNLEIILVDDGSPDNCPKICDEYAKQDSRIKVIHKENGGAGLARCFGIEQAKGEYIMTIDGDDWIDKTTISTAVSKAVETNADCVLFSYTKEYPNSSIITHVFDSDKSFIDNEAQEKIYRRLFGLVGNELIHPEKQENIGPCWMKLYKREIARKGKCFDTKVIGSSEDTLFNIYALENAKRIEYINEPFYHYRKNPTSITSSYKPNFVSQWNTLFDILEEIIKEKNLGREYAQALNNKIALSVMLGIGFNELENKGNGFFAKKKIIKKYLSTERYKKAINSFEFKHLPLSWKVFMKLCKHKNAFLLLLGLKVLNKLKGRLKRT